MANDLRVSINAPEHPKIQKLCKRLGDAAFLYLFKLWRHAAANKTTGVLTNMDLEDIEIAAGWPGEGGAFVACLIELKLLNEKQGIYSINDWAEHNPWVYHAGDRKKIAKEAAKAKWGDNNTRTKLKRSERLAEARRKGRHTKAEWNSMVAFFNNTCVMCEGASNLNGVVKDHLIPVYQGGSDSITNLQPLCVLCNVRKGPDNTDYRTIYCSNHGINMPLEWQANACTTPAQRLRSMKRTPAPSPLPVPSPTPFPSPEPKEEKKTFAPDSEEIRLSEFFINLLDQRQYPWLKNGKPNIQVWARDFDKIIRIDGRLPEMIRRLLVWCQADSFWQDNILSPSKLRKQWAQLELKMRKDKDYEGASTNGHIFR